MNEISRNKLSRIEACARNIFLREVPKWNSDLERSTFEVRLDALRLANEERE